MSDQSQSQGSGDDASQDTQPATTTQDTEANTTSDAAPASTEGKYLDGSDDELQTQRDRKLDGEPNQPQGHKRPAQSQQQKGRDASQKQQPTGDGGATQATDSAQTQPTGQE